MNTRNIWAIAFALLIFVLAGCAAKTIQGDYSSKDDQNEGIVFFSISHDLVGGRAAKAIFYLDGGVTSGGSMVFSLPEAFPGISAGSQFKDSYGQLIALALPAGKHQIDSWQIFNGKGLRIFPREKPSPLEFNVQAGQAKYLGNLHANLQTGKNVFGMTIVGNGSPEVRDRRDRDVENFEKKYPQFKGKILIETLALGPWISAAGTYTQMDAPPPVQPLPAGK
jgi:hypothetical protein